MMVIRFLMAQTKLHNGRIPFRGDGLEDAASLLARLVGQKKPRGPGLWRIDKTWILDSLASTGYLALEELLETCFPEGFSSPMGWELEDALLRLHDAYVVSRNVDSPLPEEPRSVASGRVRACIQCGECCVGEATGPLSTSPSDISLWERLGREDLLYHTEKGAWGGSPGMEGHYICCPFLRFTISRKGICLVHPVKPLICREFFCGVAFRRGEDLTALPQVTSGHP
jgi:Fe-S-cluster containining protein